MSVGAVIVAAGSSSRMQLPEGKSKLDIILANGVSVLDQARSCIEPFVDETVIVGHGGLPGGETRALSVKNGVEALSASVERVLIHDAARPLVDSDDVKKLLSVPAPAVILARRLTSTIKKIGEGSVVERTLDREMLFESLTPQLFQKDKLLELYKKTTDFSYTDEAALFESFSLEVRAVITSNLCPKVTYKTDIEFVNALISSSRK